MTLIQTYKFQIEESSVKEVHEKFRSKNKKWNESIKGTVERYPKM